MTRADERDAEVGGCKVSGIISAEIGWHMTDGNGFLRASSVNATSTHRTPGFAAPATIPASASISFPASPPTANMRLH